jgi:hypothetical protein
MRELAVMAGLDPAIHIFCPHEGKQVVDARGQARA